MDLDKALRAMQHSDSWQNSVQAAALLEGVEYTPQLLAAMTKAHLDDLVMDTETLEIQVPKTVGEPLLAAVAAYEPPLEPEDAKPVDMSTFAQIDAAITGFTMNLLDDTGREMGKPWQQPAGAHDAYPKGWIAAHNDKAWESLAPYNVWEPGVSGWREIPSEGNIPAWVQPAGAHDAYKTGDTVTHNNAEWTSNIDGNVWEPGVYGWSEHANS